MANCIICAEFDDCPWRAEPNAMCSRYRQRKTTNANRIRSMLDEELAHILCLTAKGGIIGQRSEDEWLNWLKQEFKDD